MSECLLPRELLQDCLLSVAGLSSSVQTGWWPSGHVVVTFGKRLSTKSSLLVQARANAGAGL